MLLQARILVAEDDPELLGTVSEVLARLGATVVEAASGAELIDRLAEDEPFDLIVTDVSMPWTSGLQVMQSARTAGLETAVIIITAVRDERLPAQVQALGRHVILLRKPFELAELEDAVAKLLSRHQPSGAQAG